jgi:hypothetical protein
LKRSAFCALQHLPEVAVAGAVVQRVAWRMGAQCAACAALMMATASSTSAAVGAKASTMGRICAGWMLHMRV